MLLIISSSSLALAKHGYAQLNLVSYYDEYFQESRELRSLERSIVEFLQGQLGESGGCLVASFEMQLCESLSSEVSNWKVYGRKVTDVEHASFGVALGAEGKDITVFEIRDERGVSSQQSLVYQVSKTVVSESSEIQVERKLLWTSI
ncbi:hypothetical protein ACFOEK_14210 [Litoribrevibacter euphylliae]|uniref:DUF4019 domain-containing protein n=1 Tax=Litoribrevibacter euphylliae TaxID=1834034 RepID=A0ABV7HLF2_9GAMM